MSQYLSDSILGCVDGAVTSFAIISAAKGASMSPDVALIIGFSGLIADAVSLGICSYLSAQTVVSQGNKTKTPLFAGLSTFFSFIIMGLIPLSIFFISRMWSIPDSYTYPIATALTLFSLFLSGVMKGIGLGQPIFSSGLQTAGMGGFAALVAYGLGYFLELVVHPKI
jgi:VIT1/CCC1 family predicted Fe2+/Mn2+ transporter